MTTILKNELIHETSIYLLQHAHNPVYWQAWNDNTLALAKKTDKPILLSIGYAACHWCHVMENESFENLEVAKFMNENFINIKVDREERPDVDHLYMDAVQAITGSGGWPLNVFLTPDAKPFYGGTYFPPQKVHGRASWQDVLTTINQAWLNKRADMETQANNLIDHLTKSNNFIKLKPIIEIPQGENVFIENECKKITLNLLEKADTINGGFGKAPKFPQTFSINCLMQAAHFYNDKDALKHAELSLKSLYEGGIYDQLAGGLCRYSTDNEWLAPHFEKMLYDNALFIISLSNAYLLTKKDYYKNAINHVCKFLMNELKSTEGGYFSAIDADSEGEEGKYYTWSKIEIDNILGEKAAFFNEYFGVTDDGNWEHKNILNVTKSLKELAQEHSIDLIEAEVIINNAINLLLIKRNKRKKPTTDDKILLSWNALLITSFCKAYAATQQDLYKQEALSIHDFVTQKMINSQGELFHTFKNGQAKISAFLDDYAYLIEASISLQEITSKTHFLDFAKTLTNAVFNKFEEKNGHFFYFTEENQTDILVRKIDLYDGALPSPNAIMFKNLLYLSKVFYKEEWHSKAMSMVISLKDIIMKQPNSFGNWAYDCYNIENSIFEISIVGDNMTTILPEVLHEYIPNKVLQSASEDVNMILLSKKYVFKKTLLYLCLNSVCRKPYEKSNDLLLALKSKVV